MQLKASTDYGMRAILYLAAQGTTCSSKDIAEDMSIPRDYLIQLAQLLRNAGIIEARPGKHGGYRLAKDPDEVVYSDEPIVDHTKKAFHHDPPSTNFVRATSAKPVYDVAVLEDAKESIGSCSRDKLGSFALSFCLRVSAASRLRRCALPLRHPIRRSGFSRGPFRALSRKIQDVSTG